MGDVIRPPARRPSRFPRRPVVSAMALVPSAVFVATNVLEHVLGVDGAAAWVEPIARTPVGNRLLIALVLLGPVAGCVLAARILFPTGLRREGDAWEVRIRLRPDRWAIATLALSLAIGGILAAYLVAENLACWIGARTTC